MPSYSKHKRQTGISIDLDVYEVLTEDPLLNRSAFINYAVRKELVALGILEA